MGQIAARRTLCMTVLLVVFSASMARAADESARFLQACGTPDRDVAVFNSYMPPQRTLYYDRAGFAIHFELPKQPQGPLPRDDGKWFWPTVKPPYDWEYVGVGSLRGDGCVPSNFFLKPCCHISVEDKYRALCPQALGEPATLFGRVSSIRPPKNPLTALRVAIPLSLRDAMDKTHLKFGRLTAISSSAEAPFTNPD